MFVRPFSFFLTCSACPPPAAARAPGVPGVPTRALAADDGGQAAGSVSVGGVQRGRGPQGAQVAVRAPQGPR